METIRQLSPKQLNLTVNFEIEFAAQLAAIKEIEKELKENIDLKTLDNQSKQIQDLLKTL